MHQKVWHVIFNMALQLLTLENNISVVYVVNIGIFRIIPLKFVLYAIHPCECHDEVMLMQIKNYWSKATMAVASSKCSNKLEWAWQRLIPHSTCLITKVTKLEHKSSYGMVTKGTRIQLITARLHLSLVHNGLIKLGLSSARIGLVRLG